MRRAYSVPLRHLQGVPMQEDERGEKGRGNESGGYGGANAIDGVNGGVVALHQVRDGCEHEAVFLERAFSGKRGADHFNLEMTSAAANGDASIGHFFLERSFNRLGD